MKVECADVFVGIRIAPDGCRITTRPQHYVTISNPVLVSRHRFQSWFSNVEVKDKKRILGSMLCQAIDRAQGAWQHVDAVTYLLLEFVAVGYPLGVLRVQLETFIKRHPYLYELRCCLVRVHQIWDIRGRI